MNRIHESRLKLPPCILEIPVSSKLMGAIRKAARAKNQSIEKWARALITDAIQ